jgi:hypothetical protein
MTKAKKRAWKAMLEVVRDLLRENPEARDPTLPSATMGTLIHRPAKSWRERLLPVCMRRGTECQTDGPMCCVRCARAARQRSYSPIEGP